VTWSRKRALAVLLGLLFMSLGFAVDVLAQQGGRQARRDGRGVAAGNPDVMTVQQVEEYFDQVMLHQARTNLALTDDQFLRFGAGLRRLQTARRQQQRQRLSMVRDLNSLLTVAPFDEAAVTAKLNELDEFSAQSTDAMRMAYDAIDQSLTLRQRARFRIFEEMMERRKLDLVARARQQAGRPRGPAN
jgi:Spy/CpxP family protein refolding chaperone